MDNLFRLLQSLLKAGLNKLCVLFQMLAHTYGTYSMMNFNLLPMLPVSNQHLKTHLYNSVHNYLLY